MSTVKECLRFPYYVTYVVQYIVAAGGTATDTQPSWQTTVFKAQHIPLLVVYITLKTELNNLTFNNNFFAKPCL